MTEIDRAKIELVNQLRDASGAGMMDVQKALRLFDWDTDKALEYLRNLGSRYDICEAMVQQYEAEKAGFDWE